MKKSFKDAQYFLVKIGDWVLHMGKLSMEKMAKHYLSLVMYRFGRSNTLYSARPSFSNVYFLLARLVTSDCCYFRSHLSLVLLAKTLLI